MSDLIYPALYLFLYDLREGLGDSPNKIDKNWKNFRRKLPREDNSNEPNLNNILIHSFQQEDKNLDSEYVELLPELNKPELNLNNRRIRIEDNFEGYPVEVSYYPVRLFDTYGLVLDCTCKSLVNELTEDKISYPINCYTALQKHINQRRNEQSATLGETWMIFAEVSLRSSKSVREIALECYQTLVPGANWEENFQGKGQIFGGTIFELWGYPSIVQSSQANLPEKHHVLIAIYPDEPTARKAAALFYSWLRLFCYRHKILWAYRQSRQLKSELKEYFVPIYEDINNIQSASAKKQKLTALRPVLDKAQKTISDYSIKLSDFDYQVRTIEVNLENYQRRLEYMQKQVASENSPMLLYKLGAYQSGSSDLKFLEKFSGEVTDKYLLQVRTDYKNLSPGKELLQGLMNSIDSVRSIIEIEQAERDRKFQEIVGIGGVALAVGGIATGIATDFPTILRTGLTCGFSIYNTTVKQKLRL
ncbi:MAG: hypothetical protein QNJ41_26495 [Xenococcaceae cyanobacterium MO_188.B32]|nr:hypothetical protein [Xenococcaceae cyanobacterium MO_188.B32]